MSLRISNPRDAQAGEEAEREAAEGCEGLPGEGREECGAYMAGSKDKPQPLAGDTLLYPEYTPQSPLYCPDTTTEEEDSAESPGSTPQSQGRGLTFAPRSPSYSPCRFRELESATGDSDMEGALTPVVNYTLQSGTQEATATIQSPAQLPPLASTGQQEGQSSSG